MNQDWGQGVGDRVHPVPDHHLLHDRPALGAARAARLEAARRAVPGEGTDAHDRHRCRRHRRRSPRPATRRRATRHRSRQRGSGPGPALRRCSIVLALIYIYPVPRAGRDVVQDGGRGRGRPDLAHPERLLVGRVRAAVQPQRLPAVVHELGDRDDLRDARSRVLRLARRVRAGAPALPRARGRSSRWSSPSWPCRASCC